MTTMPVLREQVEKNVLARMLCDYRLVQPHSKPWDLWQREVPIYHFRISRCSGLHPILLKVIEVLLNFEVRRGSCEVERRCCRDRPSNVMWGDQNIRSHAF